MTALLYFLVAVLAIALSTRAWLEDRQDPARQAFLVLGAVLALAFACFSASLLPGLDAFRLGYMLAGGLLPATGYALVDRLFARDDAPRGRFTLPLWIASVIAVPVLTGVHAAFFLHVPRSSPAEVATAVFGFGAFAFVLHRLWEAHEASFLPVERTRLRWLTGVLALAVGAALLEQLARNLAAPVDAGSLTFANRGVALQGAIPPFSPLMAGIAVYLLNHSVVSNRMLDLNEVTARVAALVASAGLLVMVDGITFLWVDTFTEYPFHSTFQIFLGSLVYLAAYDPLRDPIRWGANRLFNQRGQRLIDTLQDLGNDLPSRITAEDLVARVLQGLHASGRVARASFYLWDTRLDAFRCRGWLGGDTAPLPVVAADPFTGGFVNGESAYVRQDLARRARSSPAIAETAALMGALQADVAVPFRTGSTVLGWLCLRDERWSDGYSGEEVQRLVRLADLCRLVLSNVREIEALEQRQRLAALGEMAAGLAHEIRNPLAGLKGAAQYLQGEDVPEEGREMLQVIVDEANRLDVVVRQFLDYARPFELNRAPEPPNAFVAHALALLRAQGIPRGIELTEDLAGDLPVVPLDGALLAQVMINLLQNAIQAMPRGGHLGVATRLRAGRSGQPTVEVAVSDSGPGISPEALKKLFVPFYTTKAGGTGLGLAISRRIVDAHGGELAVESEEGQGATFVLRLPAT